MHLPFHVFYHSLCSLVFFRNALLCTAWLRTCLQPASGHDKEGQRCSENSLKHLNTGTLFKEVNLASSRRRRTLWLPQNGGQKPVTSSPSVRRMWEFLFFCAFFVFAGLSNCYYWACLWLEGGGRGGGGGGGGWEDEDDGGEEEEGEVG